MSDKVKKLTLTKEQLWRARGVASEKFKTLLIWKDVRASERVKESGDE